MQPQRAERAHPSAPTRRRLLLAAPLLWLSAAAVGAIPSPYDPLVDAVVARYHLPGIAVGVIEDGEIVYAATRGELVAGSGEAVTPDTLFKIASNSKAMTSTVLARLVQQGKLDWDDPVRRHLPAFAMHDPWVSEHMQVGDLLVHRSGLPEGGGDLMLWPEPNHFTRDDVIAGLQHIRPAYEFRAGYAYDNLLYVVAGELAAAAGGAPYEELLRREVFVPLGMTRCQVGTWDRDATGNVAQPHVRRDGRNMVVEADDATIRTATMEAAGGVRCSLRDMLTWARNWLVPTPAQLQWLSAAQRQALWTPYTPMPISARRRAWDGTRFYAYGYGWRLADIDGELTVSHTGTLSGMYSALTLLPSRRSGFVFLINGEAEDARTVLNEVLTKHFTAPDQSRGVEAYADELDAAEQVRHASRVPDTSAREPATARELAAHLGVWRDPWFGQVSICAAGTGVRLVSVKSPMLEGPVMRVGERYLAQWDHGDAEAWLRFPGAGETVLELAKVDPDADFSYDYEDLAFTRTGDCPPFTPVEVKLSSAQTAAEAGLVDIHTLVPGIIQDIKYAGGDNFVGRPVDGYEATKCLLLRPVAEALARAEREARAQGMALQLWDCYRPARAVADFMRWIDDPTDAPTRAAHYPDLDKAALRGDYIAPVSGHSRGATVDLTLLRCDGQDTRCTALDMGTGFDWFGTLAHTDSSEASDVQRANRQRLQALMERHGFRNYPLEWWHYTLAPEPSPQLMFDVPIQ